MLYVGTDLSSSRADPDCSRALTMVTFSAGSSNPLHRHGNLRADAETWFPRRSRKLVFRRQGIVYLSSQKVGFLFDFFLEPPVLFKSPELDGKEIPRNSALTGGTGYQSDPHRNGPFASGGASRNLPASSISRGTVSADSANTVPRHENLPPAGPQGTSGSWPIW